jgi:hypothetical protein
MMNTHERYYSRSMLEWIYTLFFFNYQTNVLFLSWIVLWQRIMCMFVIFCLYKYCSWRSNYQKGRVGGWLKPDTCLCLFHLVTWISNVICRDRFSLRSMSWGVEIFFCFVDIGGIVDHHCLNLVFTTCFAPLNLILHMFVKNQRIITSFHPYNVFALHYFNVFKQYFLLTRLLLTSGSCFHLLIHDLLFVHHAIITKLSRFIPTELISP